MSTHFRIDDLLANPTRVETALSDGGRFMVSVAEAMALRQHLRGAIWSAETIRLTTDVARVIYQGGAMTTAAADLQAFAASLVFDGKAGHRDVVSTTVVVLVIAAAAVIGYAIGHLDADLQPDLTLQVKQQDGQITISVA
ncbi:MAG: hypothetical protein MUD11_06960 [Rhodobacteraceae bacterium]|jgi:hypothetical protein|nr:hypothetical protein [Paracoccaceae bacterium]